MGTIEENLVPFSYNGEYLVYQANELVRNKQSKMTLLEARLIRLAISMIKEEDDELLGYEGKATELATFLDISVDNIYRDLDKMSDNIMGRYVTVRKESSTRKKIERNYDKISWVSLFRYQDGIVTIKLNPELKPYLLGLKSLFTVYAYGDLIKLPTTYAIRLYELIASFQNLSIHQNGDKNEFVFSLDWLREYFDTGNKYANGGDFIRRIIYPAVAAIQDQTIMHLSYTLIKKGRNIDKVKFQIHEWSDAEYHAAVDVRREKDKAEITKRNARRAEKRQNSQ